MAWVKLDDQIPRHHKFIDAGPAAAWLWVCANAYCQSQLTDGFVSFKALAVIGITTQLSGPAWRRERRNTGRTDRQKCACTSMNVLVQQLLRVRLLEKAAGGYRVHDYLDHNLSRSEVLKKRKIDAERKRLSQSENSSRETSPRGRTKKAPK